MFIGFLPPEEAVWRKMVSALMLFSAESGYILQKTNVDNTVAHLLVVMMPRR